ncbi:MAG: hypothetical protein IJ491_02750 [Clostridia bacterium]|nr:hypothetical protein [Clostridia bacterium]
MKKAIAIILSFIFILSLYGCRKSDNKADLSLQQGETSITGIVEQVNGNTLIISDGEGGRYSFYYSDEVACVIDGYYVMDLSADFFKSKRVSVICSSEIMETYPAQLKNERMLIVE